MARAALLGLCFLWVLWLLRRASGRLAPRAALAPLLFLVTRLPVLVAWSLGTMAWLGVLLPSALQKGVEPSALAVLFALAVLCGGGVAVLVVGPIFFAARAFATAPKLDALGDERVLHEIPAGHFLNGEARGGKLVATSRRLVFVPHRFNVQLDVWSMEIADLKDVVLEGERLVVLRSRSGRADEWLPLVSTREAVPLLRRLVPVGA